MTDRDSNVRVLIGDIFKSPAQTWVNTVNTVGVMGKGIALGFKQRFPEMYRDYVIRCERGEVEPAFLAAAPEQEPRSRIPAAWVALVAILARIEDRPLHWPVGHVTFQKIAYFATVSGIPTGLEYSRGPFGPFSPDVKKMISR